MRLNEVIASECAIDTADHVKHGPTGETWLVGYVRNDKLAACGWPDTLANLSDCTLVKKATQAERLSLLQEMAKSTGHRAGYARERLATSGVPACDKRTKDGEPCSRAKWHEGPCVATSGVPEPEIVVTKNEAGQIVAVTRQDAEGRILEVIAESASGVVLPRADQPKGGA